MECKICTSKKTNYFAEKDGHIFYRCTQCKTVFLSHLPSASQLNKYYASQFTYSDGLKNETLIRKRSKQILKKINSYVTYGKTLCDVGSGYGFFLDEARSFKYQTYGIEPSLQLVQYAKKQYGIHTFPGSLSEFTELQKKQFDVVTCIHVIEHVSNPKHFISLLLKLVKPGGVLYVETPNSDSHLFYAEKNRYTFLIPPAHLWLFSQESIQQLLTKNAHIVSVNTYSYPEHFMGILKALRYKKTSITKHKNIQGRSENNSIKKMKYVEYIHTVKKCISYILFDKIIAPICTGMLNWDHKGSILELYIRKNK